VDSTEVCAVQVNTISDTITDITLASGRTITLIGTAHVSADSVAEVEQQIRARQPDHVCLEIDAGRYQTMIEGQKWEKLNIGEVLRQKKGFLLLANLVLSSFQRRIGNTTGITPGDEMRRAAETAQQEGIAFSLCDREIQLTLKRAWYCSGFWNKMKLAATMLASIFTNEDVTEADLEQLKQKNALQSMMEELSSYLPTIKEVLIDERDQYLATKIYTAPGDRKIAVVGAGHGPGIIAHLEALDAGTQSTDLSGIETIPNKRSFTRYLPYIVPVLVISLMVYGFIQSGWDRGVSMFVYWFMVNGILSGIAAIAALAHPVTVVLTFLLAPFTSLNPTIGVGIVSGLVEAYIRKPRVIDFERLQDDILSLRGFYRNRFTHALVVFFLTSLGSSAGTFIAFPVLINLVGGGA